MRLLYATSIDLPSTRANRIQVTSMADAFSRQLGNDFLLGLSRDHTGARPKYRYVEMDSMRSLVLAWEYLLLAKKEHTTHIYCREERLLFFTTLFNSLFFRLPIQFVYELHHLPYLQRRWFWFALRYTTGVVSVTHGMKERLVALGYPAHATVVAPDAVDVTQFGAEVSKEEAREKLQLPVKKNIIMYTGSIDEPWKGVGVLYEAARKFGDDYLFVFVGGKPHYVDHFYSLYPQRSNVLLVGQRPHSQIPLYLKAADLVVVPNSAVTEISRISTSPMKLFEYMAAGRPIVASDLPSLREILNEKNSVLVLPDNPEALADGIERLIEDPDRAVALAQQARRDVSSYTWDNRAAAILAFMQADTTS
jgi:glycosyltransferase involved in cell wall biosynthesis